MVPIIVVEEQAGDARVDSREIAQHLGVKHKNTLELIERYADRFRRHGLLPFQTEAVKRHGGRGTKHARYVLLNEDQCYFLLALSRNSAPVVNLKSELVAAFGEARRADALQSLSVWNAAFLRYRADKDHVSRCARDMHSWGKGGLKDAHLHRLIELDPQMAFKLAGCAQ